MEERTLERQGSSYREQGAGASPWNEGCDQVNGKLQPFSQVEKYNGGKMLEMSLTKLRRSCNASCIICRAFMSSWYRSSLQLLKI